MPHTLTIRSADGTDLGVRVSGRGRPLVLVHGIAGNAERWVSSEALAEHFTLFALDRRGRGQSGDGAPYRLEREGEDVAAVLERAGSEALLFGHSFGGLVALLAAELVPVERLLVYEPYAPAEPAPSPSVVTQSYIAMLGGNPEALLDRFFREIVQMPPDDLERVRRTPSWTARVAAAPTIPREMAAVECHRLVLDRLVARKTRVRFLLGERSPPFLREATRRIHGQIPGSDVVPLPGQGHVAMDTAPSLFEQEVRAFSDLAK
jgi:pimeloyl-ACP methyl ester carboxylesterase